MRQGRSAIRSVLRFVASVMMVSGVLMIGDAGATLAWQEPISAFLADRQQGALDNELIDANALARKDLAELEPIGDPNRRLAELAARQARRSESGDAIGRVELPTLDRSYAVVEGTDTDSLRKGPGHFPGTPLPGQRGTVAVAGHRTTYGAPFRTVDDLRRGDPLTMSMPYGRFEYEVERTQIVPPTQTSVTRRVDHDQLILSACHPLYSAEKRIIVFARLMRAEPTPVEA